MGMRRGMCILLVVSLLSEVGSSSGTGRGPTSDRKAKVSSSMRASSPSWDEESSEKILGFALKKGRGRQGADGEDGEDSDNYADDIMAVQDDRIPAGQLPPIGRVSMPRSLSGDPSQSEDSELKAHGGGDGIAGSHDADVCSPDVAHIGDDKNIFGSFSRKIRRLATAGSKSKMTDIKLPDKGSRSAKYVEAVEEEPEETELTRLNRKLRKDYNRDKLPEEVYPDVEAERVRKRLVRKAMVNLYNLASVKKWQQEEKMIEHQKAEALMPAPGLKSLGWKGDARFKNPDPDDDGEGKKPTYKKPARKKKPEEAIISQFNEMMRDETFRRKIETSKPVYWYKMARRVCNRQVRRKQREMAQAATEDD